MSLDIANQTNRTNRWSGLASRVGGRPFNVTSDLWQKVGADGHAFDARAAVAYHTVEMLADQMRWGMDRIQHHGVEAEHVLHRLQLYHDAVDARLPAEYAAEVNAYVNWMINYHRRLITDKFDM